MVAVVAMVTIITTVTMVLLQSCFKYNFIDGKKLIHFWEANNLIKIGITDFQHIKQISQSVRSLLNVEKIILYEYEDYVGYRSISLPPEDSTVSYLQVSSWLCI